MNRAPLCLLPLLLAAAPAQKLPVKDDPQPPTKRVVNPKAVIETSQGKIVVELFADAAPKTVANFLELAEGKKEWTDPATGAKVKRPFYDGLIFHRVIKDFMIQGGCPKKNGTGSPGFKFEDEINAEALGLHKLKVLNEKKQTHPLLMIRSQEEFEQKILRPLRAKLGIGSDEEHKARQAEVQAALKELTVKDAFEFFGYKYDSKLKSHEPKRGCLAMANSGPNTNGSQFFINLKDTPWLAGKHTVFGRVVEGMEVVDKIGLVAVGEGNRPVAEVKILSIRPKR